MEKVWEIKDPDSYLKPKKRKRSPGGLRAAGRSPARAYTLSLLFWGSGQSYNEEYGKALVFQLLLFVIGVSLIVAAIFRKSLLLYLQTRHLLSQSFLAAEILLLVLLTIWVCLADDAYRTAARSQSPRFSGIPSRIYPGLCSMLLPGWGQFLNGQPLKGGFLSALAALGIFSLVSIPAVFFAWPFLEPTGSREVIEDIFAASVLVLPLLPFLWLFSIHDALLVSLDEYRKEPLWERIKAANNRRRTQGMVQGVVPWIGRAILLLLVLAVCVLVLTKYFPGWYYKTSLASLARRTARMGMTLLPELIARIMAALPAG